MNLLANLMTPQGAGGNKKKGGSSIVLYPSDAGTFLKYGIAGFVGFGVYSLAMQLAKRNINPEVEFQDPVESMNCDPIIRDAFINIQSYRELNPWLFKSALQNVDQLLFLEDALLSRKVRPVKSDKIIAFSYFRMGSNRLGQLQWLIKEKLSSEHALTFNLYARKIYAQLQKHLLNILHLCSEFKPQHLIERAPLEIARILKDLEENRKPEDDSLARWEKMKKRSSHRHRDDHRKEDESRHSHRKGDNHRKYREEDSRKSRSVKSYSKKGERTEVGKDSKPTFNTTRNDESRPQDLLDIGHPQAKDVTPSANTSSAPSEPSINTNPAVLTHSTTEPSTGF